MNSNRHYKLWLVFWVALSLVSMFLLNYAKPAAAEINLKWATHWSEGHKMAQTTDLPFIKMVEEATNGRVKFKYYPGQQLGKMPAHLEMLKNRVCDIAYGLPAVYSGKLPLNQVTYLPFITSRMTAAQIYNFNRKLQDVLDLQKEFEPYNCFPLYYWATEPTGIWTKSRFTNLNEIMKAAPKLRSPGGFTNDALEVIKCVPVAVNDPEMYTSLQTGLIDGVSQYPSSFLSWKLYEVCRYALMLDRGKFPNDVLRPSGWILMNRDVWNKIPKKDQDIILDICLKHETNMAANAQSTETASIEKLKSLGVTFTYLSVEDSYRYAKLALPTWDKWAQKMGEPGRRVLEKAKSVVDQMGCLVKIE